MAFRYKTSTGGAKTVVFVVPYCAVTRTLCFFNQPVIRVWVPSNHHVSNLCSLPLYKKYKYLESRIHEFQDPLYNFLKLKITQTFSRKTSESCCLHLLLHYITFTPSIYPSFLVLTTLFTSGLTMHVWRQCQPGKSGDICWDRCDIMDTDFSTYKVTN